MCCLKIPKFSVEAGADIIISLTLRGGELF